MPEFFPSWVVVTHLLNIFFMLLLFRSGSKVLSAFPKLYWHDDCPPEREWLRLSKKMYGADSRRLWTSLDEEESWSPAIALRHHPDPPGRKPADHPRAGHEWRPAAGRARRSAAVRIETQLGFKMVKWITGIEFVADVTDIGMGMGGWREDQQFYANAAGI